MNYWQERQAKLAHKTLKQTQTQLARNYKLAMRQTIKDFENTYLHLMERAADDKVTPADLYKLSNYWELQGEMREILRSLGEQEGVIFSQQFEAHFRQVYESLDLAGKGGAQFGKLNEETARSLINEVWCADGKSWSDRIWGNTETLAKRLNDSLVSCVASGSSPSQLKRTLQQDFGVSYHQANTIARTEIAHIQTAATQQRYKDWGITQVEVLVEPDACEQCHDAYDGKVFEVGSSELPPLHPNCECCILPIIGQNNTI